MQLHQHHAPLPEPVLHLDPIAGALVVEGLEILIVAEGAVTLDQAEALDVLGKEIGDGIARGVAQRTPQPFSTLGLDGQTIGIMHLWPEVRRAIQGIFTIEEHRGQRRQAHLLEVLAREERGLHLDVVAGARFERKAIRTGDGGSVQQGMHGDAALARFRRLDPELDEIGKLLPRSA